MRKMERLTPNIRCLQCVRSGVVSPDLVECINHFDDEAIERMQDSIMGYINDLYGDSIEDNLRMDPQFSHLFKTKQKIQENLDQKGCVRKKPSFPKKFPTYKTANRTEPKKLLEKVESKSKTISKKRKSALKNITHVDDTSTNNSGSYSSKTADIKLLSVCTKGIQRSLTQTNKFDKTDQINTEVENSSLFVMKQHKIENSVGTNSVINDLHYWDLNENVQQNEIYFSNADYNEENLHDNPFSTNHLHQVNEFGSLRCGKINFIKFQRRENEIDEKRQNKKTYSMRNKIRVDAEEGIKFDEKNIVKTEPIYCIEKYLRPEELKKGRGCTYNFGNSDQKNKYKKTQKTIRFTGQKQITSEILKQELNYNKKFNEVKKNYISQNRVVVENLPINNFPVDTDICGVRFDEGISYQKTVMKDMKFLENISVQNTTVNKFNSIINEKTHIINNFEMSKMKINDVSQANQCIVNNIQFFDSKVCSGQYVDQFKNKFDILSKKLKIDENVIITKGNIRENRHLTQIIQGCKDKKHCSKKITNNDIGRQEKNTVDERQKKIAIIKDYEMRRLQIKSDYQSLVNDTIFLDKEHCSQKNTNNDTEHQEENSVDEKQKKGAIIENSEIRRLQTKGHSQGNQSSGNKITFLQDKEEVSQNITNNYTEHQEENTVDEKQTKIAIIKDSEIQGLQIVDHSQEKSFVHNITFLNSNSWSGQTQVCCKKKCEILPGKLETTNNKENVEKPKKNVEKTKENIEKNTSLSEIDHEFKRIEQSSEKIAENDLGQSQEEKQNYDEKSVDFNTNSFKIKSGNEKTEHSNKYIAEEIAQHAETLISVDSDEISNIQYNEKNINFFITEKTYTENSNEVDLEKSSYIHDNEGAEKRHTISKIINDNIEDLDKISNIDSNEQNIKSHCENLINPEENLSAQISLIVGVNPDKIEKLKQNFTKEFINEVSTENDDITPGCENDTNKFVENHNPESFSDIDFNENHERCTLFNEDFQKPVNCISFNSVISAKVEEVFMNETVSKIDQAEKNNISNPLIKNPILKNSKKQSTGNKTLCKETIIRRSSLRNKTPLAIVENNIETQMLVKITYDKGNSEENISMCKEIKSNKSESNKGKKCSEQNNKGKKCIEQSKSNVHYNLRSSVGK